jgi:serine/threonine-protein kinase
MPSAVEISGLRVRRCGSYLLGRRIGAGGMATVFAARQQGPRGVGRLVAVKVMSAALGGHPKFQKMFLREASIATRLEHPNVVRVYEVGENDGDAFLAMELVHGVSLSALQHASPDEVPLPIALRIVCDVARGVHAAHELRGLDGAPLGLVHQDVSPHNVMVGYDGSVKLLDFGVARIGALDASRTETVRGKPSYLAPEQINLGRLDRRVDVFSLGIILHELCVGSQLFRRETPAATFLAVLHDPIPDVRALRAEVPEGIAQVVARALRRAPEERFETAEQMRSALADACARSSLGMAGDAELGAWAAGRIAPELMPQQLEREIVDATPASLADPSERPTVPPTHEQAEMVEPSVPARAPEWQVRSPRSRRSAVWLMAASLALAGGAAFVWLAGQRAGVPAPGAPLVAASPASAAAAPATPASAKQVPTATESALSPAPPAASSTRLLAVRPPDAGSRRDAAPAAPEEPAPAVSPPAPSAPPPPPPEARLRVHSNVSGAVRIDGVLVGDSPIPSRVVAPGTHTVTVTTSAGTQQQSVTAKPGQEAAVRFVF